MTNITATQSRSAVVGRHVDKVLRLALRGTDVRFRRSLRLTGVNADTIAQIEKLGGPYLAAYSSEWAKLEVLDHDSVGVVQMGFYFDDEWRHPETGQDLAEFMHRVLSVHDEYSVPWRQYCEDNDEVTFTLAAYVRRVGDWLTIEVSNVQVL